MSRNVNILAIIATVISSILFYGLYLTDNKYTHPSAQAEYGILLLDEEDDHITYLTGGWEFYQYQLLSPEDFDFVTPPVPTDYIYIGQYMGFDMDNINKSPLGSATYRMNIFTGTDDLKGYTLELPEIFSAYSLWINGELLAQNGNPDPLEYRPEMSHGSISFAAKDRIDIVFAVSNFRHYYSGIVYPPAFGHMRDVNRAINASMVISALRCFLAVAVGVFYLFLGRFSKDRKAAFVFGILCFLYAGSASHQLVHFVSSNYFTVWYAVEDICFFTLLAGFVYISVLLFHPRSAYARVVPIIGIVAGIAVAASTFTPAGSSALVVMCLSLFVKAYKIAVVCFLFYTIMRAAADDLKYSKALLAAVSFFGVSLVVDMAVKLYEPIRYGWPTEIGGFVMVCVLGAIITIDAIEGLRERISLAVEKEQLGVSYELLAQKIEQTQRSHHDLRHHMAALSGFLQSQDYEGIASYISSYMKNLPVDGELYFSKIPAIDAVVRYYYVLAKNEGVNITISMSLPETTLPEQDLCVLFGNLLENATDACRYVDTEKKYVHFMVTSNESFITIVSDNSCDGILYESKGIFHSRKRSQVGIGTASIRAIAEKYDGYANFHIKAGEFQASIVLQIYSLGRV